MKQWTPDFDLTSIPDEELKGERARRNNARRVSHGGGRPRSQRCACGKYTVGQAKKRSHECKIGS